MTVSEVIGAVKGEEIWELWKLIKRAGKEAWLEAQQGLLQGLIDAWVACWVGRARGEGGSEAGPGESKCPSCQDGRVRYAGKYVRRLLLCEGSIQLSIPRLRCTCGAWVGFTIPWLGRRRRLGADVVARALELIGMRVSLRDAAESIGRAAATSMSPQTVSRALTQLPPDRPRAPRPGGIGLDGVHVREKGRGRVMLVAQDEDRGTILDWEYAPVENGPAYRRLVGRLWRRGATEENGLNRVLGDGAGGIWQVVDEYWPWVDKVNCWWHQLMSDRQADRPPTPRPASEGRVSTARLERWNREFRRRYRQMEAFRSRASVQPTMKLLAERTLARRTSGDWLDPVMSSWLSPNKKPNRRATTLSFTQCS